MCWRDQHEIPRQPFPSPNSDRSWAQGLLGKGKPHLAHEISIAIIPRTMTSKTLVHRSSKPLTASLFALALVASSLLPALPLHAQVLEMTELIAHPQYYDRKEVVVMGRVHSVQAVVDKQGRPAYQFLLEDKVGTLKVTFRTAVLEGDQVIVEGTFTRRRQSGRLVVYNEVAATSVKPLNELNPDLVG